MFVRIQLTLCWTCLAATAIAVGLVSGCTILEDASQSPRDVQYTDFPSLDYGFGHQTILLFSFDGSSEEASKWHNVSEAGISNDPRVQRFVDCFRTVLRKRHFECDTLRVREERAMGYLSEPTYLGGYRLAEAEITTRERNGTQAKYFRWRDIDDTWAFGAFEDELGRGSWGYESSLRAVYGRSTSTGKYADFLQLRVDTVSSAMAALAPSVRRTSQICQFGVMGIIAHKGDAAPVKLVQQLMVHISTRPKVRAMPIDELVAEALNAYLGADEVVQFYPHASLHEFGDTDARVEYYSTTVSRSVVLPVTER